MLVLFTVCHERKNPCPNEDKYLSALPHWDSLVSADDFIKR